MVPDLGPSLCGSRAVWPGASLHGLPLHLSSWQPWQPQIMVDNSEVTLNQGFCTACIPVGQYFSQSF